MSAPTKPVLVFRTPDHRVWVLARDYVDAEDTVWHWDGRDFDPVAGPEMVSPTQPLLHMPLIGLARHCRLHSDMRDALAHGELVCQHHDEIEAGLAGGTA